MFSFHPQSIIEVRPYLVSSLWFSSLWYWLTGLDDTLKLKSKARRTDSFDWICLQPPTIKYKVGIFMSHYWAKRSLHLRELPVLHTHNCGLYVIILFMIALTFSRSISRIRPAWFLERCSSNCNSKQRSCQLICWGEVHISYGLSLSISLSFSHSLSVDLPQATPVRSC